MTASTQNNSCLGCPSYLPVDKVVSKFKKSTGAPMCLQFGHVLGRPGSTEEQRRKIAVSFGSKCPKNGEPAPPSPNGYAMQVCLPDPAIEMVENADGSLGDKNCTTCGMCSNYIPDRFVAEDFGWGTGMCAAKGKLILQTRQSHEARNCDFRSFGETKKNTINMHLLPEFEDAFSMSSDPTKAYFKNKGNIIEPHDWPTDKPVDDTDKARGIKAWRKFVDPEGTGNETYLPVYDPEYFAPEERVKIPRTGDDEHPEKYVDHFGGAYLAGVTWRELDETPALWGPAGTGKTEYYRYLAWLMCLPFERISITAQTEIDDLAGKMMFTQEKGTYFQYGRLPRAWNKPCVLCIDEPNVGMPEVWQFIRPLTDNSKQMVLDMNEGERISRHDDCYMGMAMNPAWDVRNVGTNQIGDADANRLFHVAVELPPEKLEREIIKERIALDGWELDNHRLDLLMNVANELRELIKDDTLPISWGLRPQIKVARALRWFDPVMAYRRAVADYLEPEAQEALLTVVRSNLGE